MSNTPNFGYGLDPFLPFISNFDETSRPMEQDPWASAPFGFDGNLNFFNGALMESYNMPNDPSQAHFQVDPSLINEKLKASFLENAKLEKITEPQVKEKLQTKPKSVPKPKAKRPAASETSIDLDDDDDKEGNEMDKRRRNTLASARFRIRKKQKEADLERTAKEMTEKAEMLENKVQDLEKEIKLLRSLLLEKSSR